MPADPRSQNGAVSADDERAIARYLYLLKTAPPEAIEQVHADAFRTLSEAQRGELLARIAQVLPPYERGLAVPVNGTPIGLARLITRAEMRQPGTVARLFGPMGGVGGWGAAGLLGGIAGAVAVSAIAAPLLTGAALALAASAASGAPRTAEAAAPGDAARPDELVSDAGPVDGSGVDSGSDTGSEMGTDSGSDSGSDFGLDDLFDA